MKKPKIALLVLGVLWAAVAPPVGGATEGRVAGTVVDPEGNPIPDVQVTLKGRGFSFETTRSTNKNGKFTLLVLDSTKEYMIQLAKDGFVTVEEPIDPQIGETLRKSWTMTPGSSGVGGLGGDMSPATVEARGQAARLYSQGVEALQGGDLEKAKESFLKVIEQQPDLPEAHSALAMVYARQEAYQQAIDETNRVLELRPGDVVALKVQYEAYRGIGDREKEEALLDTLIEASPDADLARMVFNSGVAKVQARDLEAAARRFEQARQMDPSLLPAYSALARVYFDLGRYDDSIEMAKQHLASEADDPDVLGVLYLTYEKLGRAEEAEATFEALKAADPGRLVGVIEELGVAYFNNGETERAQKLFERVLEAQPDHARGHYHLALCSLSQGDTARAKQLLNRFLQLAPDDPEAAVAREMLESL